jgi:ATP-dependent helicase HrpA
MLFPGSGLFKQPGAWIVAAEMVETSRLYARQAAVVDVAWLESLGGDLCRRQLVRSALGAQARRGGGQRASDPVRSAHRARPASGVRTHRSAAGGRPVHPQRPGGSGDLQQPPGVHAPQRRADRSRYVDMEDRIRRRDILVDEEVLVAFYKERLPDVYDIRTLKHRIRKNGGDGFLRLNREMLIQLRCPDRGRVGAVSRSRLDLGHRVLDCDYAFTIRGTETDGVTLNVPADAGGELPKRAVGLAGAGIAGREDNRSDSGTAQGPTGSNWFPWPNTVRIDSRPRYQRARRACPRP